MDEFAKYAFCDLKRKRRDFERDPPPEKYAIEKLVFLT